ncbi:glycosyltransferase [Streptomyces sp. NBC_01262]|uniref:glycosyltransferase n=1 Tax=Streptomyces sp. NBC_01262 TaxID=2903803 RepID=UPI002E378DBF|nr:glycosyltransferase [Streptomyces sp. NBC_01262]
MSAARVAVLADSTLDGDSRAHRVAAAAAGAGYEVTLIGRAHPSSRADPAPAPPGVRVLRVPVAETLHRHRRRRPRPGVRWPLAYRSEETYDHRNARLTAQAALIATRTAELGVVHRPLPLQAAARTGHAGAHLVQALRRGWTAARSAQFRAAVRARAEPGGPLDDAVTALTRLLLGKNAWRRLDPLLLDLETAYGPVLDELRPHLVHALGHGTLGVAVRAAYRSEGAGHRIEVVWDAFTRRPASRRPAAAQSAHERAYASLADGVVTVADSYAEQLRKRHALPVTPVVALNAPPYEPRPRREPGVREACRLAPEIPLLVHSGSVAASRGLLTVVEALPQLYDLHAAFVVPDPAHPDVLALTARAAQLGVARRLHVLPYVPPAAIPAFLASADIGVLPVHPLPDRQLALPTRYFEYAHARLPVVVSDIRAMSAATLELGIGEVFRARSTPDFVRAVGAVLTNPRRYRKAYDRPDTLRQWSWQTQSVPLLDLYARLFGPGRNRG